MADKTDKLAGRSGGLMASHTQPWPTDANGRILKVFPLPDGQNPPKGYVIALVNHRLAPGIHAVQPDQKCQECWGRGFCKVGGEMMNCSCVLRRIDRYVRAGGA
jgi:hypothetical protein